MLLYLAKSNLAALAMSCRDWYYFQPRLFCQVLSCMPQLFPFWVFKSFRLIYGYLLNLESFPYKLFLRYSSGNCPNLNLARHTGCSAVSDVTCSILLYDSISPRYHAPLSVRHYVHRTQDLRIAWSSTGKNNSAKIVQESITCGIWGKISQAY